MGHFIQVVHARTSGRPLIWVKIQDLSIHACILCRVQISHDGDSHEVNILLHMPKMVSWNEL